METIRFIYMFWGDRLAEEIAGQFREKISRKETLILRDEKTLSGRVHVGSMRSVGLHGTISQILEERGIAHRFLYEINDFDPMDGLPVYLDQEKYRPFMGKPLCDIPSPDGSAANYAEYFAKEYVSVIEGAGFTPEFYRGSAAYRSGKYNDCIRIALDQAPKIRELYRSIGNSQKGDDWYPLSVICESCGNVGTTKVSGWDGEQVSYSCSDYVEWAKGCGHSGKVSPFDGRAKLPWKVEWAAKFVVFNVDIEGAGKDHYTKGGARGLANAICEEVFKRAHPFDAPHEFILVGGKKMSSSKGQGSSAKDVFDQLPPQLFRFLLIYKEITRAIDFVPDGDTIPVLYDTYDKYAEKYWAGEKDDDVRAFLLAHPGTLRDLTEKRFLPRFSQVAFLVQMPHLDLETEAARMKGEALTEADRRELIERATYARKWLSEHAPEEYRYAIAETLPEAAKDFTPIQKQALGEVLSYISNAAALDGQAIHTELHEIRKRVGIEPKDFFGALYLSLLGKGSGPKAGWFLSVLDKPFLVGRLSEVVR